MRATPAGNTVRRFSDQGKQPRQGSTDIYGLRLLLCPNCVHSRSGDRAAGPSADRTYAGFGILGRVGRPDDTVDHGGVVLVSPVGEVDARIATKLSVLETAFLAQRRALIPTAPSS